MFIVVGVWVSPLAIGAAVFAAMTVLRAPWWGVLLVVAACAALAVAAAVRLGAWYERRGAMVTASWPQQRLRAEAVTEVPAREVPAALPPAGAPAIGTVYHFNFFTPDGDTHAAIIRKAITGPAGDATTEGK